ncbi:hypothetical protein JHK86_003568 [Glycine max]|nr:hypothetical protein JHK86_003568 [Glycine max]
MPPFNLSKLLPISVSHAFSISILDYNRAQDKSKKKTRRQRNFNLKTCPYLASRIGFDNVIIESDCHKVVSSVNNHALDHSELGIIIDQCPNYLLHSLQISAFVLLKDM